MELGEVFRAHGAAYRKTRRTTMRQRKVMRAIETCRTAELGGHLNVCRSCGHQQVQYNSCRDRHCPKCQTLRQAKWLAGRMHRVLPINHFHVVFTLPAQLRALVAVNRKPLFDLLFRSSADTLLELGKDPTRMGAHLGLTAVLHTWDRKMRWHPHVHAVVTAGGLAVLGSRRWIHAADGFLFPVHVMSKLFRGKFMAGLDTLRKSGCLKAPASDIDVLLPEPFQKLKDDLYSTAWVVYSKAPFDGAKHVFSYLSRYTHRVAISNHRLLKHDQHGVQFATKNGGTETIEPFEFIRRFLMHLLPHGYVKMRHYGLMAPANINTKLQIAMELLNPQKRTPTHQTNEEEELIGCSWQAVLKHLTGIDLDVCPQCGGRDLIRMPLPEANDTS